MAFNPVRKVNAFESIVDQIEHAVETGELRPGDRLPGERQLQTDFSVSRATVREALRVLQATGTVESKPGDPRGPLITAYSPRMLEKSISRLALLESVSRVELLQFRLMLEGNSCKLAAQNHTPGELLVIEERLRELQAIAEGGTGSFGVHVNRFHAAIRKASGNQLIEVCGNVVGGIMSDLADRRLSSETNSRARIATSAKDAGILVDAIRRRSAREAEMLSIHNIYRYYADDLDAEEVLALSSFVSSDDA